MVYNVALNSLLGEFCEYRPVGFSVDKEEQWEVFTSNACEAFSAVSHNILASMLRSGWVDRMSERKEQPQRVMVNEASGSGV